MDDVAVTNTSFSFQCVRFSDSNAVFTFLGFSETRSSFQRLYPYTSLLIRNVKNHLFYVLNDSSEDSSSQDGSDKE